MALPLAIKLVAFLALGFSGLVCFLYFIGGGASGDKAMASDGYFYGGLGMLAVLYSFYLLTRPSLLWWQLVVIVGACWPVFLVLYRSFR